MTERKDERDAKQDARKEERREGRPEHEINRPHPENPIVDPPEAEQLPTEKPWRDREPDTPEPIEEVEPEEPVEEPENGRP